jgi:predicted aconitase with swiveling domain
MSGHVEGTILVAGAARGRALVLDEPLSFWGGLDAQSGEIVDRRHPQSGAIVTGRVLVMPSGRGSSSSSTVLAEAIRAGSAPAAVILRERDGIVALGAIVAEELYGRTLPVVVSAAVIPDGRSITIDGTAVTIDDEAR